MVGQTISHYLIEEKLGQGGMGVVYRARDTRLGRTVALKMLVPELAADPALRRRLETEARAASALNHPVIATIHDFETVSEAGKETPGGVSTGKNECAFIVYEYVPGTTLREVMRARPLALPQALDIAIRVADGLSAAHAAGVIHRDLKPENVMVTEEGRVKILDFGVAKVIPPSLMQGTTVSNLPPSLVTQPGFWVGTVPYMSPEQLESEPVDHRADVFAFGVMLYELAAQRHPFAGKSPISTIGNILKEEPAALPPATPAELDRIIRKSVRKRREERYASARDLLVDLENLRRDLGGPISSSTPPRPEPPLEFGIARRTARALFLLIQTGYLAIYFAALYFAESAVWSLFAFPAMPVVVVSGICGIPVRLYLLAAVGLDHPQTGAKFRLLFPAVLLLDLLWASVALFLFPKVGWAALALVAALAYLPFSQRTLVRAAYR